jgi:hypothetical protein
MLWKSVHITPAIFTIISHVATPQRGCLIWFTLRVSQRFFIGMYILAYRIIYNRTNKQSIVISALFQFTNIVLRYFMYIIFVSYMYY